MARVKPKKHLGQHFLKDEHIAKKIVDALRADKDKNVIEIGPGMGVLTKHLLERFDQFSALDVDEESISFLKDRYPEESLGFRLENYLTFEVEKEVAIVGNFPYNISSQLFFKIWDDRDKVDEVVCMIQKEVADRIYSKKGSKTYGILSVLLQAFYDIEYLFQVPPDVFDPPPKVQSAVIRLTRNKIDALDCDEQDFKKVVKAGFGKRRKTLRNALKELNLPSLGKVENLLGLRAEQLSVDDFIELTNKALS